MQVRKKRRFQLFVLFFICLTPLVWLGTAPNVFGQSEDQLVFIPLVMNQASSRSTTFYVSKLGNNGDGDSWDNAWNELDQIDWDQISPGDTIFIDGGSESMTYTSYLALGKSGSPGLPIRISLSMETGRNGQAIFFGGRTTPLPYCYQTDYQPDPSEHNWGIITVNHSWIEIDGGKWRGISIHGYEKNGIRIDSGSTDIKIRNIEVYDNGTPIFENGSWFSDQPGVRIAGKNMVLERLIVHDNGQDAIQSGNGNNNLADFTLRQSWLHNARKHPEGDESFNFCTHTDGIQVYNGGAVKGFVVEESIIGPGLTQGMLLGDPSGPTSVQDVLLRNVLAFKAADNNIAGYRDSDSFNWVLDHVTLHCPNTKGFCLRVDQTGHSITDSIVYDGLIDFRDDGYAYSGNCLWQAQGDPIGEAFNLQLTDVTEDAFTLDDYAVLPGSPCEGKGSSITSVDQLLSLPD